MGQNFIQKERFLQLIASMKDVGPLLVLGDVGVDKYTMGKVQRISPEAPVPVVEVEKEWHKLGLAANVSDNLIELGISSTLCGVIGEDAHASLLEELLEERKLKTWGIVRARERRTILKERVTTQTQQICRVDYESREHMSSESISKILRRVEQFLDEGHQGLIIQDYGKGLLSEGLCRDVFQMAESRQATVYVDPSRYTPPRFYKGARVLKPNLQESELMAQALGYRGDDLADMAKVLMDQLELEKVVITLGPQGMALMERDKDLIQIPTLANEVYDVSGAGDTVISLLASALEAGASLIEAAWLGNCAAGVVVGKIGTANVSLSELEHHYALLLEQIQKGEGTLETS